MTDATQLLNQLIQTGKDLAGQGRAALEEFAENKLDVPAAGPERDEAIANAGKGAAAAGALLLLLGTKGGRALTGTALKVGSLAALGGLAYKTYRDWESDNNQDSTSPAGIPVGELTGPGAVARSQHLLRAMVSAASADTHITDAERQKIMTLLHNYNLGADTETFMTEALENPADIATIATGVDTPTFAAEIYVLSASVLAQQSSEDRRYLDELGKALGLAPALCAELEQQALQSSE